MPQVTRLSRATVVGFRGSPMGPRPPAAGVGWGCVISTYSCVVRSGEMPLGAARLRVRHRRKDRLKSEKRPKGRPPTRICARRWLGGGRSALRDPVVVQRRLNLADVDVDA